MYLTNHDLGDLYHLLCGLRAFPEDLTCCKAALEHLAEHIASPVSGYPQPGVIRRLLRSYFPEDNAFWSWVHMDASTLPAARILKRSAVYGVLTAILQEISNIEDSKQLYLLCDAIHNLPLVLAEPDRPHMPFDDMLAPYRMQYNPDFLLCELNRL